ncbi:MAG: HNH endonuclease [Planctomycetota bacterium]
MIRLELGEEPVALTRARSRRLAKAIELFGKHGVSDTLRASLDGYREAVAEPLFLRQHKRCAYCERPIGLDGNPVEHFRPKREAHRDAVVDQDRYWWLTWTWENLVLACESCNARKGNHFPLEPGSQPLPLPTRPTGGTLNDDVFDLPREHPMLLDPRHDDPHQLCWWTVDDPELPMIAWKWRLNTRSERARRTVELLALDAIADFVDQLYLSTVLPQWRTIETIAATDAQKAASEWRNLEQRLLREPCMFPLALWSMLDRLRSQGGLVALNLPATTPPIVRQARA